MLGHRLTLFPGTGQHHFVIDKIRAKGLAKQGVRPVHIFGVDRCHDEACGPAADAFVIFGLVAGWLRRTFKSARKAERVGEISDNRRVF